MKKVAQGKFTVILSEEDEGGYSIQCVELPGAISQGETGDKALRNIKEAIQGFFGSLSGGSRQITVKERSGRDHDLGNFLLKKCFFDPRP